MADFDSSDGAEQAPVDDGSTDRPRHKGGPSAEELQILLEAASRLPPDKLRILLKAIWAAIGH
jgi:hypothetical protein